jgi:hypothetical protein
MFGDTNLISQNFKKHGSTNVVFNVEAMDLVFSPEVFEISCIDGGNRKTTDWLQVTDKFFIT